MGATVEITDEHELREILGVPLPRAAAKDRDRLHPAHLDWLAASPFCLVATSGADGSCDVSPKGDPAGRLTHVIDDRTIALAERPGNRRGDGFLNILRNPHVGLLFLVPGRGDTLRINGRARILADAPYREEFVVDGHEPRLLLEVAVEQVFFHCAKAFLRAQLWQPDSWNPAAVASRARIAKSLEGAQIPLEELERYYGAGYAAKLYRD
ncbi:pyridoxamine 5'-phosphate oxidase family protein [Aeromicrobium phragmitis]|uniref:Pyridoxamine 5'-phosphate oxidase family protein n=1 Tax=Aeromicrobium phragmitis TaxID=2478914 RepID=A0A3L8PHR4_9ACTN|nr:pyridoxamine 5'-phosphate oxidase family protein [Aeromicrobium phragmitis]RLV54741.1 pyridoxamine 5'-phosphate oxidase family protein [Aeromicrobium phragmitis]